MIFHLTQIPVLGLVLTPIALVNTISPEQNTRIFKNKSEIHLPLQIQYAQIDQRANNTSSIFYISKSDNGNQAHYRIQLDNNCSPIRKKPVDVYWRMENGTTEELLQIEEPAYGIANQSISRNTVTIEINGLKNRNINKPITVTSFRSNNGICQVKTVTTINKKQTNLLRVHISLSNVRTFLGQTVGGTVNNITLIGSNQNKEQIPCTSNCDFGSNTIL